MKSRHPIQRLRKAIPRKALEYTFGNRIDVESDPRIAPAAEKFGVSVAALTWRIADFIENQK